MRGESGEKTSGGGGGVYSIFIHGRSRTTIDRRIPAMPERSPSGLSPIRQALLAPSTKRREVFGESHEEWTASFQEPLVRRTSAPCAYFLAHGWQRQWVRLCFLVWSLQRLSWVLRCNCLVGALPYSHYAMRSFPLGGVRVLHHAQYDLTRKPSWWPPKKKKRYPGCLAHAVSGMVYSSIKGGGNDELRTHASRGAPRFPHARDLRNSMQYASPIDGFETNATIRGVRPFLRAFFCSGPESLARVTYHSIPYQTIPYHTIPYHTIPYHTIPYPLLLCGLKLGCYFNFATWIRNAIIVSRAAPSISCKWSSPQRDTESLVAKKRGYPLCRGLGVRKKKKACF